MNTELRLLLIEDSEDDTFLCIRTLERAGFKVDCTVVTTADGMSSELKSGTFDIIIADFALPSFNADQALVLLNATGQDIPFIIVSGNIGEETAVRLMRQGARDYLSKSNLMRLGAVVERELQEALIRRQKREADESMLLAARQWQETFNSISDIVLVLDRNFRIVQANQAALDLLGGDSLEGTLCYQKMHGTTCPPDFCIVKHLLADLTPQRLEFHAANLDGRWFDLRVFPVLDSAGNIDRIVHSLRDISEQKKAEQTLRDTERQLHQSEKLQAVGQLAGGIAHDFNNQLTGIMGFADLISTTAPDEKLQRFAQEILRAASRAAELTAQLLAFSRKGNFLLTTVDLNKVLLDVVAILNHSIDKRIRVVSEPSSEPPLVMGDYSQLQSATLNLCLNARDAMPEGGELRLACAVVEINPNPQQQPEVEPGRYCVLSVRDTGPGVPPEIRDRIFDPFFTTKPVGKGTGLGLSAVYGTVKAHHGAVLFDNRPEGGAEFRLLIPYANAQDSNAAAPADAQRVGGTILIIDDEPMSRDVAAESLRSLGYQVAAYDDGLQALEHYRAKWEEVNLILLDLMMPQISGKEVFHRLRAINPNARVLLASGYAIDEDIQKLINEGHACYIQKPYRYHELAGLVQQALKS